jgi:threonine dehydratase
MSLPGLPQVEAAARRIAGRVDRTPLVGSPTLSRACGREVLLKLENRQRARCFKPRGALNAALVAAERGGVTGLLTFSSGNHGQAVALAARELSVPCVVVAPEDVRPVKRRAMEDLGARVVLHGFTSAERMREALRLRPQLDYTLVPPYDDPDIVAGQGTVGLEIDEQAPAFDVACVQVGGGGLISGVALALAALRPSVRVVGVEPADADDARRSLLAGRLLANERPSTTTCDGLRGTQLGELNWSVVRQRVGEFVTVTDEEVEHAAALLEDEGLGPVEPSGAAGVAAILEGRVGSPGDTVVAVLSGGNAS